MYEQEIYQFIRDNMRLTVSEDSGRDYGGPGGMYNYRSITVKLLVTNPETKHEEEISSEQFSIETS